MRWQTAAAQKRGFQTGADPLRALHASAAQCQHFAYRAARVPRHSPASGHRRCGGYRGSRRLPAPCAILPADRGQDRAANRNPAHRARYPPPSPVHRARAAGPGKGRPFFRKCRQRWTSVHRAVPAAARVRQSPRRPHHRGCGYRRPAGRQCPKAAPGYWAKGPPGAAARAALLPIAAHSVRLRAAPRLQRWRRHRCAPGCAWPQPPHPKARSGIGRGRARKPRAAPAAAHSAAGCAEAKAKSHACPVPARLALQKGDRAAGRYRARRGFNAESAPRKRAVLINPGE